MKTYPTILVPIGTRCTLCKEFETSYNTVKRALNGIVKTPTHLEIRERAIQLGGVTAPNPTNEVKQE